MEEAKNGKILVGFQEIGCHMMFDIKMDSNFTRKARLVAPASITYSSVVSHVFPIPGLNDLDVYAANNSNAYLYAPCREKIWTVADQLKERINVKSRGSHPQG